MLSVDEPLLPTFHQGVWLYVHVGLLAHVFAPLNTT